MDQQQPTIESLKDDVLSACHIMDAVGLVEGYGHMTARIPGTDKVIVSPRTGLGLVQPDDLLVLDLDGNVLEGSTNPPREYFIHSSIYRARKDVQAICRTQAPMGQAFSTLGIPLRPVHGFGAFLKDVPVFPKPFLILTQELGDELALLLGSGEAVLLRGNGTAVVGPNVQEARVKAIFLEESATVYMRAAAVGQPLVMTKEEIAIRVDTGYDHYGRAWEFYKARVTPETSA